MSTFKVGQTIRATRNTKTMDLDDPIPAGAIGTVSMVGPFGDDHITADLPGLVTGAIVDVEDFEAVEPAPLDTIKIKPGQVWAATADPEETYRVIEVRDGDVWSENRYGGHVVLSASLFPNGRQLVTDATPAPLDPKNVKAGDMVTLKGAPAPYASTAPAAKVEGMVREVLPDGRIAIHGVRVFFFPSALIDHQPAPEPEPEWGPGTFGWADVPVPHGRAHGFLTDRKFVYLVDADESTGYNVTADFSNFNPDVVIDPADVDVDGVAAAIANEMGLLPEEVEPMHREAAVGALRALGIAAS